MFQCFFLHYYQCQQLLWYLVNDDSKSHIPIVVMNNWFLLLCSYIDSSQSKTHFPLLKGLLLIHTLSSYTAQVMTLKSFIWLSFLFSFCNTSVKKFKDFMLVLLHIPSSGSSSKAIVRLENNPSLNILWACSRHQSLNTYFSLFPVVDL